MKREDEVDASGWITEDEFLGPKDGKDGNPFLAKKILRLDWGTDQLQVACTRHVWCDRDTVVLTT